MERKMAMTVSKFSSHKNAEENDVLNWSVMTGEERFEEWAKIFNMYCSFQNLSEHSKLVKVVSKTFIDGI